MCGKRLRPEWWDNMLVDIDAARAHGVRLLDRRDPRPIGRSEGGARLRDALGTMIGVTFVATNDANLALGRSYL
jgi:hypothetical protein